MSSLAPTLTGVHVQLEQPRLDHVAELAAAANEDRAAYDWTAVPSTDAGMRDYVDRLLGDQALGAVIPFVQRRLADGALVGCTRFLSIQRWVGRELPAEVEIGGTWLAASAQRTAINTEAKLLLLTHAFEDLHVDRVAICTDVRNERSRVAILRLGATFEGVLRSHRASYVSGEGARDTAVHSIITSEWPHVKDGLLARLGRKASSTPA